MIAAAVQAREATDAELLRQELEPMAEAVSVGPQSTGWLANPSFLVDRGSADRFRSAVDQFRQKHPHMQLRVNGPLPPFSFVDTSRPSRPRAALRKPSKPQQPNRTSEGVAEPQERRITRCG